MDINKKSLDLHRKIKGKLSLKEKIDINYDNLPLLYTPGVAAPCMEINKDPSKSYDTTWKENSVAVISDGSRVLGLGNIGPLASLPLLEGKALIFKKFGNVDAVPLPISQLSVDESVSLIKSIQHSFGGINLEDIETPKCYELLDRLIEELDIPVWHDDQQGTATIIVATLLNAIEASEKNIKNVKIVLFGAGAANTSVYRLLTFMGVESYQILMFDKDGVLGTHRDDVRSVKLMDKISKETNPRGKNIKIEEAMKGADIIVALSCPGPNIIKPQWIKKMNEKPVVFACANPVPEIMPSDAIKAGAYIVATGRSDFPNQANNALVFPGMFRGALDVRAKSITYGMAASVAREIASIAREQGLRPDFIVPRIDHENLHYRVAKACRLEAIRENIARKVPI